MLPNRLRTSHAVIDSLWDFIATSTQAEKGILPVVWTIPASPSSPRLPRRLRLAFLAVFAPPSSPSSPRLPRRLRLAFLAVFASPSSPSSPRLPRLIVFKLIIFISLSSHRHCRIVFARTRLLVTVIVEPRIFGILFCFFCCFVLLYCVC
ncbi:hypothetical protein OUZ56_022192 [Daphnia magna]|uniref:Uncharacterized protein n=1 Tax=Daphnia magna TaxID=35525 RepID=A0ABR0AVN5_9CRUS|nr:hypothetical protein OUZ56_022192 [Daphnia magna]